MVQPLTPVLTPHLFTLTCLVALLAFGPCSVRTETTAASTEDESGVQFTATPETIVPHQTQTLRLRCALGEGTKIDGNVSAIEVKRGKKAIASVTSQEGAKALAHEDQLTVEGSLEENGNASLSLAWSNPGPALAEKYKCEVVLTNLQGKKKTLYQFTRVQHSEGSIREVIASVRQLLQDEMSGLKNEVDRLKKVLNGKDKVIVTSISELRQHTDSAIQALGDTVQGVKNDASKLGGEVSTKDNDIVSTIERLTDELKEKDKTIVSSINGLKQHIDGELKALRGIVQEMRKDLDELNVEVKKTSLTTVSSINGLRQRADSAIQILSQTVQGVKDEAIKVRSDAYGRDSAIIKTVTELRRRTDSAIGTLNSLSISVQGVKRDVDRVSGDIIRRYTLIGTTINGLREQTTAAIQARVPLIQQGYSKCIAPYVWINFPRYYKRSPAVFVSFRNMAFDTDKYLRVNLQVWSVYTNRFKVVCSKSGDTSIVSPTLFQWISIEK